MKTKLSALLAFTILAACSQPVDYYRANQNTIPHTGGGTDSQSLGSTSFEFSEIYDYADRCQAQLQHSCSLNVDLEVGERSTAVCGLRATTLAQASCIPGAAASKLSNLNGAIIELERKETDRYTFTIKTTYGKSTSVDVTGAQLEAGVLNVSRDEGVLENL